MAKQTSIIPFTGKLGNVIGYERNGQYFLRCMPEVVRQTAATRRAAYRFGLASRKGALIRNAFYGELDIRYDSGHTNRLNRTLIAAGNNYAAIKGLRFNQHAGIDRFFTVAPKLFRNNTLHIPPQTLPRYKGITALEVKVIAARIAFTSHRVNNVEAVIVNIDISKPFEGINVPLDVTGDGSLVVTLQVRGMQEDCASSNRQYLAADIIAVAEPQTMAFVNKHRHPQVTILQPRTAPDHTSAYQPLIQRE